MIHPSWSPIIAAVPRISEFYGIAIEMYCGDHPPPHFHARYADDGYWVRLTFSDGVVKEIDLGELLAAGGVFAPIYGQREVLGGWP